MHMYFHVRVYVAHQVVPVYDVELVGPRMILHCTTKHCRSLVVHGSQGEVGTRQGDVTVTPRSCPLTWERGEGRERGEDGREGGRDGRREREEGRKGGMAEEREGGTEGGREGWQKREKGREGGSEGGRDGRRGREGWQKREGGMAEEREREGERDVRREREARWIKRGYGEE